MLPEYPKFKPIEIKDKKYFEDNRLNICESAFANLVLWRDFDRPEITLINQNPCVLINPINEPPFFLQPFGNHDLLQTIKVCLDRTKKLSRVSEDIINQLPVQEFKIKCLRSHFDYIYSVQKLAELKGRKLDGKRNHIKKFKNRHPDYKFLKLGSEDEKEALELFEQWFKIRQESRFFPKLAHEAQKKAIKNAFHYFKELELIGGKLIIDNQLAGFVLGSKVNPEMISLHFMYTHPHIQGISPTLLQEACQNLYQNFKYINLEQDLGIPGLRKSKLSYYPDIIEKKYEITPL